MSEHVVTNGDVQLVVGDIGEGPPILFLHGWPDTSALWTDVVESLAECGFRCLTPDLRGCGRSSKPEEIAAYKMAHLVTDVVAILDALEVDAAHVVGHDWGASLAWATAAYLPARVDRLCVLSVGHPTAFRQAGIEQQVKSWYTLLFGHPGLGEKFLRQRDHEVLRHWIRHPHAEQVIAELERDGQMSAHLRWYQANLPPDAFLSDPPTLPQVTAPTLGVWSDGDVALTEVQMTGSAPFCDGGFTFRRLNGFGHWIPLEAPDVVTRELEEFLRASP